MPCQIFGINRVDQCGICPNYCCTIFDIIVNENLCVGVSDWVTKQKKWKETKRNVNWIELDWILKLNAHLTDSVSVDTAKTNLGQYKRHCVNWIRCKIHDAHILCHFIPLDADIRILCAQCHQNGRFLSQVPNVMQCIIFTIGLNMNQCRLIVYRLITAHFDRTIWIQFGIELFQKNRIELNLG